jgi:hypothetical protein
LHQRLDLPRDYDKQWHANHEPNFEIQELPHT